MIVLAFDLFSSLGDSVHRLMASVQPKDQPRKLHGQFVQHLTGPIQEKSTGVARKKVGEVSHWYYAIEWFEMLQWAHEEVCNFVLKRWTCLAQTTEVEDLEKAIKVNLMTTARRIFQRLRSMDVESSEDNHNWADGIIKANALLVLEHARVSGDLVQS